MVEREIKVTNLLGIHARPASMIVQTATGFDATVSLQKDGVTADAKSIMSVMMLAAGQHSTIKVTTEGSDEQPAMEAVVGLFARNFNEE